MCMHAHTRSIFHCLPPPHTHPPTHKPPSLPRPIRTCPHAQPELSPSPDFTSVIPRPGSPGVLDAFLHFESPLGSVYHLVLDQAPDGALTMRSDWAPVDFSAWGGVWSPCAGGWAGGRGGWVVGGASSSYSG